MTSDLRIAARTLLKSPGFALTAIAALAVGIGANSAIFSLVNQVLLNPPGISQPERVVATRTKYEKLSLKNIPLSPATFGDLLKSREVFSHAAVVEQGDFNYTGGDRPERLQGARVSVEWFDVFRAQPQAGRVFHPDEDQPNTNNVVVLAQATWQRMFGGDPGVVGRTIELNQMPYKIVGVMNADFRWPSRVDLWVPIGLPPEQFTESFRFNERLFGVARLRDGVSIEKANAWMKVLTDRVYNNGTDGGTYARGANWGLFVVPLLDVVVGDTKTPMLVLLAAVAFVLLIACSNIAGLMLARTWARSRDIAIRVALGAGRMALLRQTMCESLLLSTIGGALGLMLSYAGVRALLLLAPEDAAATIHPRLDTIVVLFTGAISLLSGALFALAPALQLSRLNPQDTLKSGGRSGTAGRVRQRMRAALVIAEAALAVVLLVGAGLFLRSFARLQAVDPGFKPRGIMTASLSLPRAQYAEPEKQTAFYRAVQERLAAIPGVKSASMGMPVPFSGMNGSASFNIEGQVLPPGTPGPHGNIRYVAPGYFETLETPLKQGRFFTNDDRKETAPVVIIDELLARQFWPNGDALGKRIRRGSTLPWATIVGIVSHVRHMDLSIEPVKGTYFFPMYQVPMPFATLLVRGQGDVTSFAAAMREAVRAVDPKQPLHLERSMEAMIENSMSSRRFAMRLLAFFAAVALFLAALGLYGVISYSVAQRTQEIGIRMALGAERGAVLGLVVGQGLRLTAGGVLAGMLAAFALSRTLRSYLFGVESFDAVTFAGMAVVMGLAAFLASYLPARRATRIDPLEALRYE